MKRVGIVSYNMYGNFTNYGSALQTFALQHAIDSLGTAKAIVIDYCPDILRDKDILNPIENMWDKDKESRERCRLSLPAIRENYNKFRKFYSEQYSLSQDKYTSENFNSSLSRENLTGYVCGSDTIFAVPEFGFDDGFYATYDNMVGHSVAYAASFGDYDILAEQIDELALRLNNFIAIALRENDKKSFVESLVQNKPVYKVIDPTLLLKPEEYERIAVEPSIGEPYLLLYSRRGDQRMQEFAENLAKEKNLRVVEISLNAKNADRNIMRYDAGVEEFLGLVKNAEYIVTNSFHGMIFAIQFKRTFYVFSRKLCNTKISELLDYLGLSERMIVEGTPTMWPEIDFTEVHRRLDSAREESLRILRSEIDMIK